MRMSLKTSRVALTILGLAAYPVVAAAQDPKPLIPVTVSGAAARVMTMPGADEGVTVTIPAEFEKRATVTVENWRDDDVTLIAQAGVTSRAVGIIPAHSRVTLALPETLVASRQAIQLMIDTGSLQRLVADPLRVDDTDRLAIRVMPK